MRGLFLRMERLEANGASPMKVLFLAEPLMIVILVALMLRYAAVLSGQVIPVTHSRPVNIIGYLLLALAVLYCLFVLFGLWCRKDMLDPTSKEHELLIRRYSTIEVYEKNVAIWASIAMIFTILSLAILAI